MRVRADFDAPATVRSEEHVWQASPAAGVERMMLDRVGEEVARATSFVRFAPEATFPPHVHGGGEEFFVLDGAFGDEHGLYPKGSYVRNPIGTRHHPKVGPDGAKIFVKLYQFAPDDDAQFVKDTDAMPWVEEADGHATKTLHTHGPERVTLHRWSAFGGGRFEDAGGVELVVVHGALIVDGVVHGPESWLRLPPGSGLDGAAGADGALLYAKRGHLAPDRIFVAPLPE